MYTNPQCRWNSQATTFYGNQWYTCTHTKTMYDVCAHNSLQTSAILAHRLAGKERRLRLRRWFRVSGDNTFRISGASQAYFGSLKGCYQRRYYCRERLYCRQISLKVWGSKEKLASSFVETTSETPYCTIRHVFSRSWHCCKLLCKRSSSTHNYSYIDEWIIFWPSDHWWSWVNWV